MEQQDIEYKLYQIMSGIYYITYLDKRYSSVPNTLGEKHLANLLYKEMLDDVKYENIMSWEEAKRKSAILGIWSPQDDISLNNFEKTLENLKLELYKNNFSPDKVKTLKKQIDQIRKGIDRSYNNKYKLYYMTKEYYAENIKNDFLIGLSIRDEDANRVFDRNNLINQEHILIEKFHEKINKEYIATPDIRKIARSEPWRTMWIIGKHHLNEKSPLEWTGMQRMLFSYSKMYDNVFESIDCPPDEVIQDDDMLDGWFIHQKREKEKQQKEKITDKLFNDKLKGKDGQELFVVAKDKDEAGMIYGMNDDRSRSIVKAREQIIKTHGQVDHSRLPDVQMDLKIQATQNMREHMRKAK